MPQRKASFIRMQGVAAGQVQSLGAQLLKVVFGFDSDLQVLGVDRARDSLSAEIVLRREREALAFDPAANAFGTEKRYEYRRHFFTLDAGSGIAETPGSKRDFNLFGEALKRAGSGGVDLEPLETDVSAWAREMAKLYDTAQLAQLVLDMYYAEPKLIGRYSAKTVDNRLDPALLKEPGGHVRSLRLGFFHEGVRRTVELRADAVLSCTSGDEDDLELFFKQQRELALKYSATPG
jgi:hypothetical protein